MPKATENKCTGFSFRFIIIFSWIISFLSKVIACKTIILDYYEFSFLSFEFACFVIIFFPPMLGMLDNYILWAAIIISILEEQTNEQRWCG